MQSRIRSGEGTGAGGQAGVQAGRRAGGRLQHDSLWQRESEVRAQVGALSSVPPLRADGLAAPEGRVFTLAQLDPADLARDGLRQFEELDAAHPLE
ncbi:MAG: hypothetical protein JWQ19_1226 [Subtercola sp.]|nr:hypothetical protein [Subtercola sp.]